MNTQETRALSLNLVLQMLRLRVEICQRRNCVQICNEVILANIFAIYLLMGKWVIAPRVAPTMPGPLVTSACPMCCIKFKMWELLILLPLTWARDVGSTEVTWPGTWCRNIGMRALHHMHHMPGVPPIRSGSRSGWWYSHMRGSSQVWMRPDHLAGWLRCGEKLTKFFSKINDSLIDKWFKEYLIVILLWIQLSPLVPLPPTFPCPDC